MTEPIYTDATEDLYEDRVPGTYRVEDIVHDWQMKSYIASVVDEFQPVDDMIERFRYTPPGDPMQPTKEYSDLVDPQRADLGWLPWLAQLVGVRLVPTWTEQHQRDAITNAISGTQAGTADAIAAAAKAVLTGTQTVYVHPFSNSTSGIGGGGMWDVLILTIASETLSSPRAAVLAAGAKPAGIALYEDTFGADWTTTESTYPTWADWEATDWSGIEQTGS